MNSSPPTPAGHHIVFPQKPGHLPEYGISAVVAVAVVEILEQVDIQQRQGTLGAVCRIRQVVLIQFGKRPAVQHVGQGISTRQLCQLLVGFCQGFGARVDPLFQFEVLPQYVAHTQPYVGIYQTGSQQSEQEPGPPGLVPVRQNVQGQCRGFGAPFAVGIRCLRCQPWRAKRRLVVPSSREAALPHCLPVVRIAPEGKQSRPPNAASSHMGAKYGAATSLRGCCVVLGDQDCWGTNRLLKAESILGTGMSQNLSRGRRHA